MAPRLSIVISTHNRALLLSRAINSVKSQGVEGVQVIVVSDMKDPNTFAVANALLSDDDIFVQRGGKPGPATSRNMGIHLAGAGHVLFLDDDDSYAPGFLGALLPHLSDAIDEVIYCDGYVAEEARSEGGVEIKGLAPFTLGEVTHDSLAVKNKIPNNCLVFSRKLLLEHLFDDNLILLEDWDHLLNVLTVAKLKYVPIHGPIIHQNDRTLERTRNTSNQDKLVETTLQIYKKWPAPNPEAKGARQAHFQAAGINLPAEFF
ncbi:MAG TPA: glycosyltransferase family 2 protein [Aquabacterium sp.]|nr:glycosyltransferase family 2 protein [Aquabacterium sp.]